MPNKENIKEVELLTDKIGKASAVYFAEYHGLNVEDITELRKSFFENNIEFRVSKNSLLKIAIKNNNLNGIDSYLNGSTAIALAYDDPALPAKVIKEFTRERDLPIVKGMFFDGAVIEGKDFKRIADLPSKDELLSKFVAMLNSPITKFAMTINSPMSNLNNVLNQLKDTKN